MTGGYIVDEKTDPANGRYCFLIDREGTPGDNEYHKANEIKCKDMAKSILTKEAEIAKREN